MFRIPALALLLLPQACSSPQVVKEGPGWREVQASGQTTQVEVTTEDPQALATIARTNPDPRLRESAAARLEDPAVLSEVARGDAEPRVRVAAVSRLTDRAVLSFVAQNDADESVRSAAAERRDVVRFVRPGHPEHAGWTGRAPGTWVRLKVELKVGERIATVEVLRTIVRSGVSGVLLEQREAMTRRALQGTVKEMLERTDFPAGNSQEGQDSAEIGGRRVGCRTVLWSGQYGRVIARIKFWLSEEVPGGIARVDVEESPEGEPIRYLRARVIGWGS
ncbi:MAG TPA: HEAT repeat domain-containing protein [Planctomycetota bacterium]|nr:HEAT repeat domain-containing protein [Planctomycetota bacterium]